MRHGQEAHTEHDAELLPSELLQVDARDVDARDAATETVILLEGELDIRSTDWFGACVAQCSRSTRRRSRSTLVV